MPSPTEIATFAIKAGRVLDKGAKKLPRRVAKDINYGISSAKKSLRNAQNTMRRLKRAARRRRKER